MTFNSFEFLVFYPLVLALYFLLPHKFRWQMLLLASYYFYAAYQYELLFLIFGTTLVSWLMSRLIEKSESGAKRKLALVFTLFVCLGVLALYKYLDFIVGSIGGILSLFGAAPSFATVSLILPVGISFYTFQTLSYVIDVYRGRIKTEPNFFLYALYVSFFPQLVAGPIERPENLLPQLKEEHKWEKERALFGAKRMMLGFFKKIAVADLVSVYVDGIYNSPEGADAFGIILATLLFAVQIYCDFSGYTDIAIGCAQIMGIKLMKNFDRPYGAKTVKEFWSRWHISLSSWFKDYLYIPLGGNRCKKWRYILNVMIVFAVSGLWHGAKWTFVIWGLLHGVYQVIGSLSIKKRNALISKLGVNPDSALVSSLRRINTFILVCFAWIFFRANSISDIGIILKRLFSGFGSPLESLSRMGLSLSGGMICLLAIGIMLILDRIVDYENESSYSEVMVKDGGFVYLLWAIILAWIFLFSKDMISTFIYFQF